MSAALPVFVVKLGGSLAGDPSLAHWLRELRRSASARLVVVPGGGPFADAVRAAQGAWRFSDEVAHAMAIGAMDQFGRMLCGIEAGSTACATLIEIEAAWERRRLPIWLPGRLMEGDRELARTWDVTSDTIAAWLAGALGASGLVLVKSCDLPTAPCAPESLAAAGIVDPALPGVLARSELALRVVQRDSWGECDAILTRLGCRV